MSQQESIRNIILHQKKHDIVKNVILNEQERETISTIPKNSNELVDHWVSFYRSYRCITLGMSGMGFAVLMASLLSLGSFKEKVAKNEMEKKNAIAAACVMCCIGCMGAMAGGSYLRETVASHVVYKAYRQEQIKRQIQREKE